MAKTTRRAASRKKTTPTPRKASASASNAKTAAAKKAAVTKASGQNAADGGALDDLDHLETIYQLRAEVEAAKARALEAEAALKSAVQYFSDMQDGDDEEEPVQPSAKPQGRRANDGLSGDYLDMLSSLFNKLDTDQWDANQLDGMSQGLNMVLGSGPAFATLGSMLNNSTAQGSVLMNATQMQRQLDQVGLLCTSACVKQLLSMNDGFDAE